MPFLNLGCGMQGVSESDWTNVDREFRPGSRERKYTDALPNFVCADISESIPLDSESVDGCLLCHVIEHFDCMEAMRVLKECHRILKRGGFVLSSVPDASYFRSVDAMDRNKNWPELFGIFDPQNTFKTWREAALWFSEHKAILSEDTLWSYFRQAGFEARCINRYWDGAAEAAPELKRMSVYLGNRRKFSLEMYAIK